MHGQRQRYDKKDNQIASKTAQANIVVEIKKETAATGARLPAHFANAVFDEDTVQILDYKKLINHNKKETREWW